MLTSRTFRRLAGWALRATGPAVLAVLLIRVVDYGELRDILGDLRVRWLLAALGAMQLIIFLRTLRWMELHWAFGLPSAGFVYQLRLAYATSLATVVLPQIINPLSRFALLVQDGYRPKRALAGSALEKALELAAYVAFGLYGSIVLSSSFGGLVWWAIVVAVAAAAGSAALFAQRHRLGSMATTLLERMPGLGERLGDDRGEVVQEIGSLHRDVWLRLAAWSLAIAMTQATMLFLLTRSLGVDLSYPYIVAVWGVIAFSLLLPLTVNGIGTREAILVAAFSAADRSTDAAVAIGLLTLAVVAVGSSPGIVEWLRRFLIGNTRQGTDESNGYRDRRTTGRAYARRAPPLGATIMAEWRYRVGPGIEIAISSRSKPRWLSRILGGEVAGTAEPSLVLDLAARGEPAAAGASLSGSASGPATARGVYKGISWSYSVQREGGRWRVAFRSRLFQEYLALHIALLPALQRLLLDRDLALIHGAAFTSHDDATLLAGMTGSGKTALLLGAIREGGQFLGDEYLSLSAAGTVTPIIHTLALRQASLRLAGGALQPLSPLRRLALQTAVVAVALTGRRLDPLNHIPPQELGLPVAGDSGQRARRFFWLEAGDAAAPVACEPASPAEVVDKLSLMQQVHDAAYGDLGPTFDAAGGSASGEHSERWRAALARGLADVSCYRIRYPRQFLAQALDQVLSLERP